MKCADCSKELEVGGWPWCPHQQTNPYIALYGEPTIVHIDKNGNYRFPGAADAKVPKGYHKVELRTMQERERFEREVNRAESARAGLHREREDRAFAGYREAQRSELRSRMAHMSPLGRDFAMAAIKANNERRSKSADPGFNMEIVHMDSQNRTDYRDERTGWKPRRV